MGCICSKGAAADDVRAKDISKSSKRFVASLKREEAIVDSDNGGNDVTARLISNHPVDDNVVSTSISSDEGDKKSDVIEKAVKPQHQRGASMEVGANGGQVRPTVSRIISMPNGGDVAQVVAGWPSWLTAVAGEAIKGWLPRRADSFEKMDKIGQGTYSSVYRARDLETGKIVALKKVRFANMDPESVRFMAREIHILRKLDHPNVMKLEGLITSRVSGSLYLVFEYMEHDLAGLAVAPGIKLTEAQIKCYMQQLLCGLEHCHSRGVLHRDIKGSNLLIDNNGNLKIGDFGLATFFNPNKKHPLTSRVVTLWYRPPELLLGSTDYGVAVDLWSTGCILAELFAGKPIMPGRTEVEQLHKIFKLCGSPSEEYWQRSKLPHATIFKPQQPYTRCVTETFKDFPSPALALLDVLLAIQPESRGSASSALQSEFFTTKPLPCDPSSLPKYPPSKEFDAKLRNEESRRQRAAARRGEESIQKIPKESKPVLATDANAKLKSLGQKRPGQSNPKSSSEKYNPDEEGGSGFRIEPPRGTTQIVYSHSGQSVHPNTFGSSRNMNNNQGEPLTGPGRGFGSSKNGSESRSQRSFLNHGASQLSRFSNSVADRGSSRFDSQRTETSMHPQWLGEQLNARYNRLDNTDSSHHSLDRPKSSQRKEEQSTEKDLTMNYSGKNRIHYSGPLLPSGGNIDEMLKEHEKQIQHAVRKARLDKAKTKKTFNDNGQTESLLNYQRNGR